MSSNMQKRENNSSKVLKSATCVLCLACAALLVSSTNWTTAAKAAPQATTDSKDAKVIVSPNMLVSRDGDIPHVELMVAGDPKDAKRLVAGGITASRPDGGWICKTYASSDGGFSWTDSTFPDQIEGGSGDPQVAFGTHGTAYFMDLVFVKDETGRTRAALYFYRSPDGGKTWLKPFDLGYSYDHEQVVVDRSFGKYAGNVYVGVLYGKYPEYTVGVFRSSDDGRTFTGPVDAASGKGKDGLNVNNPLVFSDGTLWLPFTNFAFNPEERKRNRPSQMWFTTSSDGGVTFSVPHKIEEQHFNRQEPGGEVLTFAQYAADTQSDRFRDRLYMAWTDNRLGGKLRILFSYSTDRGNTWSPARQLDTSVPENAKQYQPMVTVNKDGVVAVTWDDTRHSTNGKEFDEYFTASTDGGVSFLPAVRVSSQSSRPEGQGNVRPGLLATFDKGEMRLSTISAASRWYSGGDYMGLTADAQGVFHPLWADGRSGTFQVWTTNVRVVTPGESKEGAKNNEHAKDTASVEPQKVKQDITGDVAFIFDPVRYNETTHETEIPVRLKNISGKKVYGPISVEVKGFGTEYDDDKESIKKNSPSMLNAGNNMPGEGATFDFSSELGTVGALAPNEISGAVVLRVKLTNPLDTPAIRLSVTGYVVESK
jgi:hypothetical protein